MRPAPFAPGADDGSLACVSNPGNLGPGLHVEALAAVLSGSDHASLEMKLHLLLLTALAAAPTLALADPAPNSGPNDASAPPTDVSTAASADQNATPTSASFRDTSAPLGSTANPAPQTSPTQADDAWRLKAGDPSVISNAPVPDTDANRGRFGQPMSHAGRATAPAGD